MKLKAFSLKWYQGSCWHRKKTYMTMIFSKSMLPLMISVTNYIKGTRVWTQNIWHKLCVTLVKWTYLLQGMQSATKQMLVSYIFHSMTWVCSSVCLSTCLSVHLSVFPPVCLSKRQLSGALARFYKVKHLGSVCTWIQSRTYKGTRAVLYWCSNVFIVSGLCMTPRVTWHIASRRNDVQTGAITVEFMLSVR